jgi:hypothetical protein
MRPTIGPTRTPNRTATVAAIPTPNGPALDLFQLPVYPTAKYDRNISDAESLSYTVPTAPTDVASWMFARWQGLGFTFVCSRPFPNIRDATLYLWRDRFGNGYNFSIVSDLRNSNRGGTQLIISGGYEDRYLACP